MASVEQEAAAAAENAAEADVIPGDLRTAADLARELGISRQRLNPYVRRAGVDPVETIGARRYFDLDGQREIVAEYYAGNERDRHYGGGFSGWYGALERWRRERLGWVIRRLDGLDRGAPPQLELPAEPAESRDRRVPLTADQLQARGSWKAKPRAREERYR